MKKTLLSVSLLTAMTFGSANAAVLAGFKAGVDYWDGDTSGKISEKGQPQQDFNYDNSGQYSLWFSVEHFIPLIPNVKIRQNQLEDDGHLNNANFSFNDYNYIGDVYSEVDLTNTDFIFYYELLDNDLVSLDLGGAYKLMDGSISMRDSSGFTEKKDIDDGVIMAYAYGEVLLPFSLFAYADILAGIDETGVYDYQVGVGWEYEGIVIDTRIRAGYREFKFDVDSFNGVNSNLKFDGFFAGVELSF